MPGYRAERISQQIQQQVSIMFARQVSDPRLAGVNVTRVEVSGDLRYAKIFVAPFKDDQDATDEMMEALENATGYFRREIASNLDLRFAPEIRFLADRAIEKGERFLEVLSQVQSELHATASPKATRKSTTTKAKSRRAKE